MVFKYRIKKNYNDSINGRPLVKAFFKSNAYTPHVPSSSRSLAAKDTHGCHLCGLGSKPVGGIPTK